MKRASASTSTIAPRKSRRLAAMKPSSRCWMVHMRWNRVLKVPHVESVGVMGDGEIPGRFWTLVRRGVNDSTLKCDQVDLTDEESPLMRHNPHPSPNVYHNFYTGKVEVDLTDDAPAEDNIDNPLIGAQPLLPEILPPVEDNILIGTQEMDNGDSDDDDKSDSGSVTLGDYDTDDEFVMNRNCPSL